MSTPPPENERQQPGQTSPSYSGPPYPGPSGPPPTYQNYPQYGTPAPGQYGGYGGYGGYGEQIVPCSRPGRVTAAAVITIVLAAIVGIFAAIVGIAFATARDAITDQIVNDPQFASLDVSRADVENIATAAAVIGLLVAALCIVAIVAAAFVLKGRTWARITVVVLAAITAIFSALSVAGSVSDGGGALLPLVWLVGSVLVIVFLFTGGAGAWFDAQSHRRERG